ncbi:quinone-dependent dihydroorotate dehydrogenase [Rhodococcus artemisiae]|uniref:Dihydroorotate dehydrogenase (quinone) n=1 Tax=Rhodococcus artemisiae TaxID=714159 RepID=A0ABU7L3H4_9NOCA|nr:quinone-dependent dihydroorotate dehydrogenase [Rhodococcus artemisiae]MEE2056091.1 quinone-dependent dihydroorotate dehydrogenase [Rhodococcus artemisiae]
MYRLLLRVMFLVPPERIHHLVFLVLRLITGFGPTRALASKILAVDDPVLDNTVFGVRFPNPVGMAAGFDKDAKGVDAWGPLGFGFAEIGTVTAQAQPGNPAPRLFRLPEDRALVNRMGFNNHGAGEAANHLRQRRRTVPIGANIGKTKIVPAEQAAEDYTASAQLLGPLADFVVVNVSSPNTPGLRDLQAVESLRPLLLAVLDTVTVPVLVKIAPDLSDEDVDAVADLAVELELAGIVATNTTIRRDGLRTDAARIEEIGAGGLSGAPVAARSLEVLRRLYTRVGDRLTLVSVGGIETPEQAWERILAGASLVQGYTGFIYGGAFWTRRLNKGLARKLRASGYASIADAVGAGR